MEELWGWKEASQFVKDPFCICLGLLWLSLIFRGKEEGVKSHFSLFLAE
jgi:hypothetical protein